MSVTEVYLSLLGMAVLTFAAGFIAGYLHRYERELRGMLGRRGWGPPRLWDRLRGRETKSVSQRGGSADWGCQHLTVTNIPRGARPHMGCIAGCELRPLSPQDWAGRG